MRATAGQRQQEPEENIGSNDLRRRQRSEREKRRAAQRPGAGRREPHFRANRKHQPWQQAAAVSGVIPRRPLRFALWIWLLVLGGDFLIHSYHVLAAAR